MNEISPYGANVRPTPPPMATPYSRLMRVESPQPGATPRHAGTLSVPLGCPLGVLPRDGLTRRLDRHADPDLAFRA